jgi:hypothetical protein
VLPLASPPTVNKISIGRFFYYDFCLSNATSLPGFLIKIKYIKMEKLTFGPWIGSNYQTSPHGRLLLIGESHYLDNENVTDTLTSEVIQKFVNGDYSINFYKNMGLLFNPQNPKELWQNVAFANAIQNGLPDSTSQPEKEDIATVVPAFWILLDLLKPEKVLVCSKRMWNYWLPDKDPRGSFIDHISENGKNSTVWKYNYTSGHCFAMGINHPSSYFSYADWNPLVMKFMMSKF